MIDGIIQEVINKYVKLHNFPSQDEEINEWNEFIRNRFLMIEKELIEKIKQESQDNLCSLIDITKLIGDNEK